jgi:hypothetical protein
LLSDADNAVRYWGVLGLHMRGEQSVVVSRQELRRALDDESPFVAIAAAQALGEFGGADDLKLALPRLVARADWSSNDVFVCVAALNSLDALDDKAAPTFEALQRLPTKGPVPDARYVDYVSRLLKDLGRTGKK